jgi:hypothetical protein
VRPFFFKWVQYEFENVNNTLKFHPISKKASQFLIRYSGKINNNGFRKLNIQQKYFFLVGESVVGALISFRTRIWILLYLNDVSKRFIYSKNDSVGKF